MGCYELIWDGPKTDHIDKKQFTVRHIDIIEQSNEKLQDTVDKLHTESERYGTHINVVKTKTIFGKKARSERC